MRWLLRRFLVGVVALAGLAASGLAMADEVFAGDFAKDGQPLKGIGIQAAIDHAVAKKLGTVRIPAGTHPVNETIRVPSGVALRGEGMGVTVLTAPTGVSFNLLSMDSATGCRISDLTLREIDAALQAKGDGLVIEGTSSDIIVRRVAVSGFRSGFRVGRDDAGFVEGLTFRDCISEGARSFGFEINNCRGGLLDQCLALGNRLDGIKLRRQVSNLRIRGGESSHNGKTGPNGNGVDAYSGGNGFVIQDLVTEHNRGAGIYVKTGPLSTEGFGDVGRGLISGVRSRFNTGSGLDINRAGGDLRKDAKDQLPPLTRQFVVVGGIFEDNGASGIYLRGREIALISPVCRRNQGPGIQISSGWDISILQPILTGNGGGAVDTASGISLGGSLGGNRIRVTGGMIDGIDDPLAVDGDGSSGPVPRPALRISKNSRDVLLRDPSARNFDPSSGPIRSEIPEDGDLVVHVTSPNFTPFDAGPGSTRIRDGRVETRIAGADRWAASPLAFVGEQDPTLFALRPGDLFFDTRLNRPFWWNGKSWVNDEGGVR